MTSNTLEDLKAKKADLEKQIREIGAESSGHQRANLHDDASGENQLNLARGTLQMVGDLSDVKIISPREEIDSVELGNKVKLQLRGKEETFHFLSGDDAIYRKDIGGIISINSPLGKAILGKKVGELAKVQINSNNSFEVKIIEVFPGNF